MADNCYWRHYRNISKLRHRIKEGIFGDFRDDHMLDDLRRAEGYLGKNTPEDIETAQMYIESVEDKLEDQGMRKNPSDDLEDFDWDAFEEGAAKAIWADAYMTVVEDLDLDSELGPGAGGDWMDVLPDVPEAAEKEAAKLTRQIKKNVSDHVLERVDRAFDEEGAGHYAAMQAMGHGVGWFDVGIDDEDAIPHIMPDLWNEASDAIREELDALGYDEDQIDEIMEGEED